MSISCQFWVPRTFWLTKDVVENNIHKMLKFYKFIFLVAFCFVNVHEDFNILSLNVDNNKLAKNSTSICNVGINLEDPNCHNDGCHDESGHCSLHCLGLHNIFVLVKEVKINLISSKIEKQQWSFRQSYNQPILDSFLKPPLYS